MVVGGEMVGCLSMVGGFGGLFWWALGGHAGVDCCFFSGVGFFFFGQAGASTYNHHAW